MTLLTDEHTALADAVRDWLRRDDPVVALRRVLDGPGASIDPAALAALGQLGLLELMRGPDGGTLLDLAVAAEELGGGLSSVPLSELALVAALLDGIDSQAADAVAAGTRIVVPVQGVADGEVARSAGTPVVGGPEADAFLLVVPGRGAVLLDREQVQVQPRRLLDLSRSFGSVHTEVPLADLVPVEGTDRLPDVLALLRAVDGLGCAARALTMTVRYAGERQQFGRAIGSFQAVKHHCANMLLWVEASRAVLHDAAAAAAEPGDAADRALAAAVAYAQPACNRVTSLALQVHGGMGFTWEHDLHLLIRRAKTGELLDGSTRTYRHRLVAAG
ncbi:MAG: acyl-CoA dehydrogenase domain protein [Frankiales bacterium]|nr:acyl-CoA dehydrogenase domain protein [Frankiales bacterium]